MRRGVQAPGDCTHQIYHLSNCFQDLHPEVVPLQELMQELEVPGEEEFRLQVIVHIISIILKFVLRKYIKRWCL